MNPLTNVRSAYSVAPLSEAGHRALLAHVEKLNIYAEVQRVALDHLKDLAVYSTAKVGCGVSQINDIVGAMEEAGNSSPHFIAFAGNIQVLMMQAAQELYEGAKENLVIAATGMRPRGGIYDR